MSNTSYNPYEIAQQQFDTVASKLGLDAQPAISFVSQCANIISQFLQNG